MFHLHDILMATGGCWPASNFIVVKSSALKLVFLNEKLTLYDTQENDTLLPVKF